MTTSIFSLKLCKNRKGNNTNVYFAVVFGLVPGVNTFSKLGTCEDDFYLTIILATFTYE